MCVVGVMLFADEMAEEKKELFFVACRCSFSIKCHIVNVKGGEAR